MEQLRCFTNDIAGGQIGPAFGRIFDKNNAAAAKAWMGMMKDGFYA
ncbi:hypothetical protein [Mahella sp.]|nr:hypothetical protein [Mahella sp.]